MHRNKTLWMSLASGAVWAVIGLGVGVVLMLPFGTLRGVASALAGGLFAAPFIGLLMGQVSRLFGYIEEVALRIIIAGISLYAAMVLFLIASLSLQSFRPGHLTRAHFWADTFGMATIAFELTFIVLWPLAYMNHRIVSRLWTRS